jgi:predicted nucleic acid-binding protein
MLAAAVVDTNVWVSAFLTPHGYPAKVYQAAHDERFYPLISEPLLDELADVLIRPRLMKMHGASIEAVRRSVSRIIQRLRGAYDGLAIDVANLPSLRPCPSFTTTRTLSISIN